MTRRNLLNTAVTRAKRLVVLMGSRWALWQAVRTEGAARRHTPDSARLRPPPPSKENFFLGLLTTPEPDDHASPYELCYYRCTGSDMRKADPVNYPDVRMLYIDERPRPIVWRSSANTSDDVFGALDDLEAEDGPPPSELDTGT